MRLVYLLLFISISFINAAALPVRAQDIKISKEIAISDARNFIRLSKSKIISEYYICLFMHELLNYKNDGKRKRIGFDASRKGCADTREYLISKLPEIFDLDYLKKEKISARNLQKDVLAMIELAARQDAFDEYRAIVKFAEESEGDDTKDFSNVPICTTLCCPEIKMTVFCPSRATTNSPK
tara:strand:- start:3362 stop:3907 length:546 start_codon:yes stop_codon:yes gene_type:complete